MSPKNIENQDAIQADWTPKDLPIQAAMPANGAAAEQKNGPKTALVRWDTGRSYLLLAFIICEVVWAAVYFPLQTLTDKF
ncbi:hypothetical protein LSTR_LSTR007377 [Laodelphax striatellus]|uniref:Uncharacterized protein n=1 Tax=Laodelphax striatellus TaxID=195883 RepID=A0A482XPK8_LAOST|nr:hypothetical protein LSTR_LSTR007377 [Laodelphax striatellus]